MCQRGLVPGSQSISCLLRATCRRDHLKLDSVSWAAASCLTHDSRVPKAPDSMDVETAVNGSSYLYLRSSTSLARLVLRQRRIVGKLTAARGTLAQIRPLILISAKDNPPQIFSASISGRHIAIWRKRRKRRRTKYARQKSSRTERAKSAERARFSIRTALSHR